MSLRLDLSGTAVRQLWKLEDRDGERIVRGPEALEGGAFSLRLEADIRALEGTDPRKYRLRVGTYRAVDAVLGSEVKVLEVFARGRGYR